MEFIFVFSGLFIGFLVAWIVATGKQSASRLTYEANEKRLLAAQGEMETQKSVAQETVRLKTDELQRLQQELTKQIEISNFRGIEVAMLKTLNENLAEKLDNQKNEIESLQKRLTSEFENIATKILGLLLSIVSPKIANLSLIGLKCHFLC